MTTREQLKKWFARGKRPTAEQFAAWVDSFWHKSEKPDATTVNNPRIQLTQGGAIKAQFNLNQPNGATFDFDAGGSGSGNLEITEISNTDIFEYAMTQAPDMAVSVVMSIDTENRPDTGVLSLRSSSELYRISKFKNTDLFLDPFLTHRRVVIECFVDREIYTTVGVGSMGKGGWHYEFSEWEKVGFESDGGGDFESEVGEWTPYFWNDSQNQHVEFPECQCTYELKGNRCGINMFVADWGGALEMCEIREIFIEGLPFLPRGSNMGEVHGISSRFDESKLLDGMIYLYHHDQIMNDHNRTICLSFSYPIEDGCCCDDVRIDPMQPPILRP
jgi:hypothetical protein